VVVAGMSIGTLFTLFVLPAVYVAIATDHRAGAESERAREIADFDLAPKALKAS
jgi:multidrug efflux pump